MNCELVRRRLLGSDSPGQPSADVGRHLVACPACRAWQRRLAQAEQQLPLLDTPPSERKAHVIHLILNAPTPAAVVGGEAGYVRTPWSNTTTRERGLRKAALAISMAAALVVFALAWWLLGQPTPAPQPQLHPVMRELNKERDKLFAEAPSGSLKRVEVSANFAERLVQQDVVAAQNDPEKLRQVATFYAKFVRGDFAASVRQAAPQLSKDQLKALAEQLERSESVLSKMSADRDLKPENRAPLKEMADAALAGRDQVREILASKAV
jgi:hypothetical protein